MMEQDGSHRQKLEVSPSLFLPVIGISAFVAIFESLVTAILRKEGCASFTVLVARPVIPATREPHPPFRRIAVTKLSKMATGRLGYVPSRPEASDQSPTA